VGLLSFRCIFSFLGSRSLIAFSRGLLAGDGDFFWRGLLLLRCAETRVCMGSWRFRPHAGRAGKSCLFRLGVGFCCGLRPRGLLLYGNKEPSAYQGFWGYLQRLKVILNMELIDTHCHLYSKEFVRDIEEVIERAENEGVKRFYLPAIDRHCQEALLALEARYPGVCIGMTGLHPCHVKADYEDELRFVEDELARRKWVAIGEIGLDFYWDRTFEKEQYVAFRRQIELALEYGLPIVIHSRESMQESIGVVGEYVGAEGIFHCFSGDATAARQIVDQGFYLGIGGVLTYKNSGLADAIREIPLEWLVLETDAPYLSPAPFRGKRNESSYLRYVVAKLAEVKGLSVEEVAEVTTRNAQKIFGI
jgi:TatD DNase family protein